MTPGARVGVSGWSYPSWRGGFYPRGLRHADELRYAAERMTAIELNGSFYSLQRPASWAAWRDAVPEDVAFAVKGPRFVTHLKRLRDVDTALANFFASGLLALGAKLGPLLWQLPERQGFDPGLIEEFLGALPASTAELAAFARRRDHRLAGREVLEPLDDRPVRHAIEVRNPGFDDHRFVELALRHRVAIVRSDAPRAWPELDDATGGDLAYARLHGRPDLYASGYGPRSLDRWADWTRGHLDAGRECFVFFDNDARGRAPLDAIALLERLGG